MTIDIAHLDEEKGSKKSRLKIDHKTQKLAHEKTTITRKGGLVL